MSESKDYSSEQIDSIIAELDALRAERDSLLDGKRIADALMAEGSQRIEELRQERDSLAEQLAEAKAALEPAKVKAFEDGKGAQAIMELRGRDLFLKGLKLDLDEENKRLIRQLAEAKRQNAETKAEAMSAMETAAVSITEIGDLLDGCHLKNAELSAAIAVKDKALESSKSALDICLADFCGEDCFEKEHVEKCRNEMQAHGHIAFYAERTHIICEALDRKPADCLAPWIAFVKTIHEGMPSPESAALLRSIGEEPAK